MANDFRGWLQQNDKYALNYTGNDGKIDWGKVNSKGADTKVMSWAPGQASKVQNYISGLYNQFTSQQSSAADAKWKSDMLAAASRQYVPPQPKLANFDIMANWRQAQSAAERAQNPKYEKQLNDFLAHNVKQKELKTGSFNLTKENIGLEKSQALEDSTTGRQRTAEDTQMAMEKIGQVEGQFQQDEGQDFDKNYRQVAEQIAASGGANTGMGKQQSADMIRLRNVTSQRQLDEFQGQREAKQLFKNRTFEDFARGDQRAEVLATNKTKAAQFDFDSYLEDLAYEEQRFRFTNESDRLEAVLRDTQNYDKAGVEAFLAGLAGQGYSAADIAHNRSVYA
jgi:hypothetical protein